MNQTITSNFNDLDFRNLSGEVASIIRDEIKKLALPVSENTSELRDVVNDAPSRNKFLLQYQEQLTTSFQILLPKELIYDMNKEAVGDYVNSSFDKFRVVTGGRYIDQLLQPVFSTAIQTFSQEELSEFMITHREEVNSLIEITLSLLSKKGIDIMAISEAELTAQINALGLLVPVHFLSEHIVANLAKEAFTLLHNAPQHLNISLEGDLSTFFSREFQSLVKNAETSARAAFNSLGESIKELTDHEIEVHGIIDQFESKIQERGLKIAELEGKVGDLLKGDIPDLQEIARKQLEHTQLVAQNLFQIKMVENYVKNGLLFIGSIDSFKDKAVKVFSGDYIHEFTQKLEELKKPTFSSIVNFASQTVNTIDSITDTMQRLGVFNGAAKNVAKFVNYAKVAVAVATALLPPNPIGIIGALGSLGGLFGGGGPSLEEQMFQAMQEGFNQLNIRMNEIENKIDKLSEMIQEVYKNIMRSLQAVSDQLQELKDQLNLTKQMLNFVIYKDYNMVEEIIKGKEGIDADGLELYKRWFNKLPTFFVALAELDKLTLSSLNLRQVIREEFLQPGQALPVRVIAKAEIDAYQASLQLVRKLFPNIENDSRTKNLLLIPAQTNSPFVFQQGFNLMPDKSVYAFDSATEEYFNPDFLIKIAEQYITLHPFFIIGEENFRPFSSVEKMLQAESQQAIRDKFGPSKGRLNNLLDVINHSLVQQSISAGGFLLPFVNNAMFGNGDANLPEVLNALRVNQLFAKNLSVYLIRNKIDQADFEQFSDFYIAVKTDRTKLAALNALLRHGQGRLSFDFNDQNTSSKNLFLWYSPIGSPEKFRMPVPDVNIIEDGQLIYNSSTYALLSAKEKIITTLVDIGFFRTLSAPQAGLYKEIFFQQS